MIKKRHMRRAAKYIILFITLLIAAKKVSPVLDNNDAFVLACTGAVTFAILDIWSPSVDKEALRN